MILSSLWESKLVSIFLLSWVTSKSAVDVDSYKMPSLSTITMHTLRERAKLNWGRQNLFTVSRSKMGHCNKKAMNNLQKIKILHNMWAVKPTEGPTSRLAKVYSENLGAMTWHLLIFEYLSLSPSVPLKRANWACPSSDVKINLITSLGMWSPLLSMQSVPGSNPKYVKLYSWPLVRLVCNQPNM